MNNNNNNNNSSNKDEGLPSGCVALENQVAGHFYNQCSNKCYILRHCASGDILKPIIDVRSERECHFYSNIWSNNNDNDNVITKLRNIVPKFNGIFVASNGQRFIRLSNVTMNLVNPSILDVKIGAITYDAEANEEKIANEVEKYAFAQQLGFRLLGMRVRVISN
jgi:inositol-polyphosphate multikinase